MSHSLQIDPSIKLFGRNIALPESNIPASSQPSSGFKSQIPAAPQFVDECREAVKVEVEDPVEMSCEQDSFSDLDGRGNSYRNHSQENTEEEQGAESDKSNKRKALKKPDKVLPCPRCNSLETKFCYFNNYNVNQPRHFCKNCHRYWTAGGTIRNVPVGAGRRRNKQSSSQFLQEVTHPDAASDTLNSASHQPPSVGLPNSPRLVNGMGEVLKFCADAPLCESMETVLNLEDHKRAETGSAAYGDHSEELSSSSCSLQTTTQRENGCPGKEDNSVEPKYQTQSYPAPQWAYPWNLGWSLMMVGPNSSNPNPSHLSSPPMMTVPGFCAPNVTFPFVPASYWGCMPGWDAEKWVTPSTGSSGSLLPSSSAGNNDSLGNSSPTLGKHSRDENIQKEEKAEQCLWFPKTLRIDDPDEAAKSSIWTTLGIKPDKNKPVVRSGIFKAFQPKSDAKSHTKDADNDVLQSNPAALSRSQSFQEKA
ncbi:hypothetical protein UlMin_025288 [Ulmus minor]